MIDPNTLDFKKMNGLIPAVIQCHATGTVRMVGYMNAQALAETQASGFVHFFSRSKGRIWKKGETSGHVLKVVSLHQDCDDDAILALVKPVGPTCHTGSRSCFGDDNTAPKHAFLAELEQVIEDRFTEKTEGSYIHFLQEKGLNTIAQKVGEEATEVVIAALAEDHKLKDESADLLFHLLVLLRAKQVSLSEVLEVCEARHNAQKQGRQGA